MNINNLIRFIQENTNYNIDQSEYEALNLVVGGRPAELWVSKSRFLKAVSYVDNKFSSKAE